MNNKNLNLKNFLKLFIPPILLPSFIKKIYLSIFFKNSLKYEKCNFNRSAIINRSLLKVFKSNFLKTDYKIQYLEIGCEYDQIFDTIPLDAQLKIGVDPVRGGTHRVTSDQFFKDNKLTFDIIFIDGLHSYQQCQKDVINSLRFLRPNGIILLHDMLPANVYEEKLHRSGDAWKVGVELNNSKNILFKIANIDNGVGIVKINSDYNYQKDTSLFDKTYDEFINKYLNLLPVVSLNEAFKFIDDKL